MWSNQSPCPKSASASYYKAITQCQLIPSSQKWSSHVSYSFSDSVIDKYRVSPEENINKGPAWYDLKRPGWFTFDPALHPRALNPASAQIGERVGVTIIHISFTVLIRKPIPFVTAFEGLFLVLILKNGLMQNMAAKVLLRSSLNTNSHSKTITLVNNYFSRPNSRSLHFCLKSWMARDP